MKGYTLYIIAMLCIIALPSCRKDLCYTHPHNGSLIIQVDWSLLPSAYRKPTGIEVSFTKLPEKSSKLTYNFLPDGGSKSISEGFYQILMTNNDYDLVHISDSENWEEIEAYTADVAQRPYPSAPKNQQSSAINTVRNGISPADLLMVSSEHTNTQVYSTEEVESQVIVLKPESRTIPIVVRIPIVSGIQFVSQARGFLSGVSPSVKIVSGVKSQVPTDVLFSYGSALGGQELRASFSLFGFVDSDVVGNSYIVGLEKLLIDGSVLYYEFEVNIQITDLLRARGGEIIIQEPLTIEPVEPPSSGEGFMPSIDGWDDENIIIPIG